MRCASSVIIPAGEPPEWIEVVPAGKFSTRDGRGPFINDDPEALLQRTAALKMDAGYPIDYDHATDFAAPEGKPAPAAGWMTEFKIENGAIMARVEWTPQGAEAVKTRNWRYISPVFDADKQGHVMRLVRAALTNNPNLYNTEIAASRDTGVNVDHDEFRSKLAKMCGLKENASHDEIYEAASKKFARKANDAKDGDSDGDDDKKHAARLIASGQVVSQESHAALLTEINTLKAERAKERATTKVEAAIAARKIHKEQREWAITYCASDEKAFDEFIARQPEMPELKTEKIVGSPARIQNAASGLTDLERQICARTGVSETHFAAQKGKKISIDLAHIAMRKQLGVDAEKGA